MKILTFSLKIGSKHRNICLRICAILISNHKPYLFHMYFIMDKCVRPKTYVLRPKLSSFIFTNFKKLQDLVLDRNSLMWVNTYSNRRMSFFKNSQKSHFEKNNLLFTFSVNYVLRPIYELINTIISNLFK